MQKSFDFEIMPTFRQHVIEKMYISYFASGKYSKAYTIHGIYNGECIFVAFATNEELFTKLNSIDSAMRDYVARMKS